ncbi:MAG: nucleotidyl transferase AbiEii/AbiGii toxin family protein [Actinobacteria bacterium]|nr:nucleotidyl transferase AbiEii/AbiGii toxin family protein [Actinomycetota bacterium]
MYSPLQQREVFHIEFLRWLVRKVEAKHYALKGGVNMRFFFNSFRYSEDIDIDITELRLEILQDTVMKILFTQSFEDSFKPYGIERVIPPDITKAKQTETTQRFKIHLITFAGEDLFTKIEFSRRGIKKGTVLQSISNSILRTYKLIPLIVSHYNIQSTVMQKIDAIASRATIQARDIFDLYILSSQYTDLEDFESEILEKDKIEKAYKNVFAVTFEQFRDSVVSYLAPEEQNIYNKDSSWNEITLKAANLIEELQEKYA